MGIVIFLGLVALAILLSILIVPILLLLSVNRRIVDPLTSAGVRRGYAHYRSALISVLVAASLPNLAAFTALAKGVGGGSEAFLEFTLWALNLIPVALLVALVFYMLGRVALSKATDA